MAFFMLLLSACQKEETRSPYVRYNVLTPASWENGRASGKTRAEGDIECSLPSQIFTKATNSNEKVINVTMSAASQEVESIAESEINNYTYIAYWPEQYPSPVPAFGKIDYLLAEGDNVKILGTKVTFSLAHQTAWIRFKLMVSSDYLALRDFDLTSLSIEASQKDDSDNSLFTQSASITDSNKQLTDSPVQYFDFYVSPTTLSSLENQSLIVTAKYDVKDKTGQLTRKDCVAKNKLVFSSLKDSSGNSVVLSSGKYYDIIITLAPDFLYVLSDNDNKSDLELR